MSFADLSEILDPTLRLPIRGKTYVIPPVSAAVGLRLQALRAVITRQKLTGSERESLRLGDNEELDLVRDCLGTAYGEMVADDVPWEHVKHAGMTAYIRWTTGEAAAETFWRSPLGEALGAPSSGRPKTPRTTGAASTTKAPASGSGTRSRRKSSSGTRNKPA